MGDRELDPVVGAPSPAPDSDGNPAIVGGQFELPADVFDRLAALAAAVEAMSTGHAKVLAGNLSDAIQALRPSARVTVLADERARRQRGTRS